MSDYAIVLGNKNYSSWSLRPWLVLRHIGVAFEEIVIPLDQPDTARAIARYSPSGRVPVLVHGERRIWDSLAIVEYLNEQFPEHELWPADPDARAVARAISAEMHAGFAALRTDCPMTCRETLATPPMRAELAGDIARIQALWADCRRRFGEAGPFLFGRFSIADAMFAPVVSRFRTYQIALSAEAAAYAAHVWELPALVSWVAAAKAEPYRMARYE